jgi:hypothetical protein
MIKYQHALTKAGVEAARSLTMDLQQSATDHGWHPDIVKHLSVSYNGSHLNIHYPDEIKSQVHNLEYGTETSAPSAVLRKFKSRSRHIDNTAVTAFSKHMGGKL